MTQALLVQLSQKGLGFAFGLAVLVGNSIRVGDVAQQIASLIKAWATWRNRSRA